jgi:hypothetical protein
MSDTSTLDLTKTARTYRVRLKGVLTGLDPDQVAARMAPLFKRPVEQIAPLLSGPAVILKRGLALDTAEQYVAALKRVGCVCFVEAEAPAPSPSSPAPAPAAPVQAAAAEDPLNRWLEKNQPRPDQPNRLHEEPDTLADPNLARMASGQKLSIDSILLSILGGGVMATIAPLGQLLCYLGLCALSIFGVLRLTRGLELSTTARVLCIVGGFVPLVGIVVLVVLSGMATRRIRAAGFKVGFFGVPAGERALMGGAQPGEFPYSRAPSVAVLALIVALAVAMPRALPLEAVEMDVEMDEPSVIELQDP